MVALSPLALRRALRRATPPLARDSRDAVLYSPTVGFHCVSPSPRIPMPPFCRDKWPQNRVRRGRNAEAGQLDLKLALLRSALWANMSRINEVRSSTLQSNTRSRLRLCAGESSSSKITVSTSRAAMPGEFIRLAASDKCSRYRRRDFLRPVSHYLASGGRRQFGKLFQGFAVSSELRDLSSTPTRNSLSPAGCSRN